ncbi:MAG: carotenoid oxygenase family protein, partial [Candidatus Competibacteraceae bacterium]|nr:carotenoid oxygenase family protein [Candidatus Competibacteraceae bacterium]
MGRQRLGFQSLTEETGPVELPVCGRWPAWLDGALIRTGPALFEVGPSRYRHWFDGLAMLYRFGFQDGRVHYTNRVLHSRGYRAARAQGRIVYDEFDTTADTGLWRRFAALLRGSSLSDSSDNANVNVIARPDGVFALTETPTPMAIDARTLATLGPRPFQDDLRGQLTTAHPHTDLNRRVQVNYLLEFGRHSVIHLFEHPLEGGTRRPVARMPVERPPYMHSFGLTDRYVILMDSPLRVHPLGLRWSLRPFIDNYRWHEGERMRFHLVDRATGTVTTLEGEPCFAFHQANAFDDGDGVVIDLCAYPNADIVTGLRLEQLRGPGTAGLALSRLRRYRLPKAGGEATCEEISETAVELPRINERRAAGRRYRSLWAAASRGPDSGFLDQLVRLDLEHGSRAA